MVNFAILGCGGIAKVMANTVNAMIKGGNNKIKLYCAASRDLQKAQDFCKEFNVEKAYGSYDEFYKDPNVDLVYIATPHSCHFEEVKKCLENGKNVLCEKAYTVNAKQAQELCKLAKEKKLLGAGGVGTGDQPRRESMGEAVKSGIIGPVTMVTANLGYSIAHVPRLTTPELAGGALLDVGVYTLNFACMVLGHPDDVDAVCVKNQKGVDMSNSMTLRYKDTGAMAVLCSSATGISDRFGMIHGPKGFIMVENINNPQSLKVFDSAYQLVKEIKCPKQYTGYEYEVEACIEALEKGELECSAMPHDETIYVMQLMDSIRAQLGIKYPFED